MNIQKLESTKDSLKSIGQRISSPTPLFWKKIRNVMIGVGGISGAVLVTFATAGLALPVVLSTILSYGVAVGATGAALSKLSVDWVKVDEQKSEQPNP